MVAQQPSIPNWVTASRAIISPNQQEIPRRSDAPLPLLSSWLSNALFPSNRAYNNALFISIHLSPEPGVREDHVNPGNV